MGNYHPPPTIQPSCPPPRNRLKPCYSAGMPEILDRARAQALTTGVGLDEAAVLEVLRTSDEDLPELLQLAHDVRMRWCGPEVEVEGIVSLKTGGCPQDCPFCSPSGRFETPVRTGRLAIPPLGGAPRA